MKRKTRTLAVHTLLFVVLLGLANWLLPPSPLVEFRAPEREVTMLFSPNHADLLTYPSRQATPDSGATAVRVWDLATGAMKLALSGTGSKEVSKATYSPDGATIVVVFGDGEAGAYTASGHKLFRFKAQKVCFSPDSRLVVGRERTPSGEFLSFWRIEEQRLEMRIPGEFPVAFTSSGARFAFSDQQTFKLWEVERSGRLRMIVERAVPSNRIEIGKNPDIYAFWDTSKDNETPRVHLLDSQTGTELKRFESQDSPQDLPSNSKRRPYAVGYSLERLVFVEAADLQANFTWLLISDWSNRTLAHGGYLESRMSASGRWLAIRDWRTLSLYDIEEMAQHMSLAFPGEPLRPVSFELSSDGSRIFLATEDVGWSFPGLPKLKEILGRPNWKLFPFESGSRPTIRVWDAADKKKLLTIRDAVNAVFSQDGSRLATLHADGVVKIWKLPPGTNWILNVTCATGSWALLICAARAVIRLRRTRRIAGKR